VSGYIEAKTCPKQIEVNEWANGAFAPINSKTAPYIFAAVFGTDGAMQVACLCQEAARLAQQHQNSYENPFFHFYSFQTQISLSFPCQI
jgi:hypothetical protein